MLPFPTYGLIVLRDTHPIVFSHGFAFSLLILILKLI